MFLVQNARFFMEGMAMALPLRVFVGYDSREEIAFEVLSHSLRKHSSIALDVIPLKRHELQKRGVFWKEHDPLQSTEFTYLRFLVPYLANYRGWALFVDYDFLCLRDVAELVALFDESKAVMVVKHHTSERSEPANVLQSSYPRKNWSSMIAYNCGHAANAILTPDHVSDRGDRMLHRFSWLSDDEVGELPVDWNFLTPLYRSGSSSPALVHYSEGGPWFPDYRNDPDTEFKEEWFSAMKEFEATLSRPRLLCPYERDRSYPGYSNSKEPYSTEVENPTWESAMTTF